MIGFELFIVSSFLAAVLVALNMPLRLAGRYPVAMLYVFPGIKRYGKERRFAVF
jgi:hypothetical protein